MTIKRSLIQKIKLYSSLNQTSLFGDIPHTSYVYLQELTPDHYQKIFINRNTHINGFDYFIERPNGVIGIPVI